MVTSGVFGRYVFARIPKAMDGSFRDCREIEEQGTGSRPRSGRTGAVPRGAAGGSPRGARAARAAGDDRRARYSPYGATWPTRVHLVRSRRMLSGRRWPRMSERRVLSLLRRRLALEQQSRLLLPFQRLFSYWHILHLPLAIVLLIVTVVHVSVAFLFGYVWIF